jgi:hypothetical protein
VSKRLGSPYRSARSVHWVKVKNPKAPAVKREAKRIGSANRGELGPLTMSRNVCVCVLGGLMFAILHFVAVKSRGRENTLALCWTVRR